MGKKSLKHVGRSHTCNPFWQVLEMLSFSLILPAEITCRDSPQAGLSDHFSLRALTSSSVASPHFMPLVLD